MGGSGRRRGLAVAAALVALCIAAPELGGVAAAATSSRSPGASSAGEPTNVVLVARRKSRSQIERSRFRRYLKRHPKVLKRQAKRYPNVFRRRVIRKVRRASGQKVRRVRKARPAAKRRARAGKKARRARAGKKARRNKKQATAKKKRRRRGAAVAGTAAARKKKAGRKKGNGGNGGADSLGWSDWLAIGLLVLAPFAAVTLLLYITDLRRRPRAPSASKRRRSLVITPHKT